jgi:hypothetical protein
MSADLEFDEHPVEIPPIDLEAAAEEQLQINAMLDDLKQQRESRESLRLSATTSNELRDSAPRMTETPYADKTMKS